MTQAMLDLTAHAPDPDVASPDPHDRTGFEIGWEHARHGLALPAALLLQATPPGQGWRAGRAAFGGRPAIGRACKVGAPTAALRACLALRLQAWQEGVAFEEQLVTPNYLRQLHTDRCPVLRTTLGGGTGGLDAAICVRLNPHAAYAAGNLAVVSAQAARMRAGTDLRSAVRQATLAQQAGADDAATLWRLAVLQSYATPLPFFEAARLPLAVLPPNRVRLLNAPQGLQALLTLQFASAGWSLRLREVAELLPAHTVRHDFNLFVGALAPRVLEATEQPVRTVLEDLWMNERVLRRWHHFVMTLGEPATAQLLEQAAARGLAGKRTLSHRAAQAVDGWRLAQGGRSGGAGHGLAMAA